MDPSNAPKLLVVEDDGDIRQALVELFDMLGYGVTGASTALDAIVALQHDDLDVVLTDIRMAGMTGIDLCQYVSEDRPGIPVVVMTAYGDTQAALGALRAGAYEFVTKPLNRAYLVELIERAIALQRRHICVRRLPSANGTASRGYEPEGCAEATLLPANDPYVDPNHCPDSAPVSQRIESLDQLERRHIEAVLTAHGGNKVLAARTLGIDRATLYRKLTRFGLMGTKDARSARG